ncbi:golgin subfamily A member 6-like protein 22 [Ischnura elegans]|uniref:golgin subfamily A member 6-like protein 22 n=1 Tax=Ischnura elegans TaxID=197161 RepID=UPI001ED86CCD|nr:golgin subfamily A member 6-like protein 22 [Ischnura elegans]
MESSGIVTYPSDSSGDEMEREETRMPSVNQPPGEPQFIYHLHSKNKEEAKRMYQQVLMNKEARRLEREEREKEMKEREEEAKRMDEKMKKERQERRRRREEEEKREAEKRAKEEKERMEEEKRNKAERRLKEEEAKANKKKKEEIERREEEIDRREREIKRREEELEKKEKQTEKRLKEKEEEGRLKMEREWKEKEEKRLKEANEEEERREKEYRKKKEDLRKREEKMREEGMAEIQNVTEKLDEERANMEREKEGLEKDKEYWKQTVRQAIEDGLRKERMIVEEEVRRSVEGELNGKWKKRVEEVDSWWKTQNSELKGEWENEKIEWELEKARIVKDMEEMRWKLVEVESLSMQLEEKNRRLKSDAELQREEWKRETEKNRRDWMEEKNNMTRKLEGKLKKDVGEVKEAGRMEMEETMNILLQNYEREIKTLKEDVEMKEKGLYELQRKLDAISSKYENEQYELTNKYQNEMVKLKNQNNDTKKVFNSKINELDVKEKELGKQLKELNELQLWTVNEVRRLAGDRTEYYSQLASQQRAKHLDALDTRVVSHSHHVRQGMSGDTRDYCNARQKAVERKEEFIGELERKWIEYANQMIGKLGDFEKSRTNAGRSNGNFFTNAISKTASYLSSVTGDASAEGSVEEHEDFTNPREVHDALNRNGVKVLSFSNGGGQDCEKYQMHDLSNYGSQLHGSNYDPLAGITCSISGQNEEVLNTDQDVDMNVGCGDLCRDVVKKGVKSTNHGEDFEVAIGGRTCEPASVNGKNSHVGNDSDSFQDWLVVTKREYDDKLNESISKIKEECDQKMMEMQKQIEELRKEMEVMRETNRQYQLQSNDQSSEVLSSNEGNVFREGGEELGGDELKDRKNR